MIMKKIMMFQDYYYVGGIEKVITDLKENLGNKYIIDIVSFVNKSDNYIVSLLTKKYRNFFIRNILGLSKLKTYLSKNNYDIIHIHCYNAFGLIYGYISKKYVKKIIIHAHNNGIDKDFFCIKKLINFAIKKLFNDDNYILISVSEDANKFCFDNKKTIILPNCIDYNKYLFNQKERNRYRKLFELSNKDIVIGHIGRFEKQKNHNFIIDVFNEILKINKNYKLILIGDGSLKNKIIKKVNKLHINDNVIFLNYRNDISKLINVFDIYLSPSLYEGFGLTILEQQVNGKYLFVSNNINQFLKISNRIVFLSLKKSSYHWAKEIINKKEVKLKIDYKFNKNNYMEKVNKIYVE